MENKMSRQIQIRRGSAAENDAFTGVIGEITMDTTNKTLRVHDGTTAGGTKLAKQSEIPTPYTMPNNYDFVIETQTPSSSNNYKWYRKYKSGWVEQGQKVLEISHNSVTSITLPVTMANTNYTTFIQSAQISSNGVFAATSTVAATAKSASQIMVGQMNSASASMKIAWEVKGKAA